MPITIIPGDLQQMKQAEPFYIRTMALAQQYCTGVGVELGAAAHNPFDLPGSINVAPFSDDPTHVDYNDFLLYQQAQVGLCGHYAKVDLVGEAHAMTLGDTSQDYVISSHVVEHLPDLISAFLEWNRILRPGGIIFMVFPKRDAAELDRGRPITPLQHFIDDYTSKQTIWTHPIEGGHGIRGHYHVFTLDSMVELIGWCNQNLKLSWRIEAVEETDSKVGNGHTVVCRYLPGKSAAAFPSSVKDSPKASPLLRWRMRVDQLLVTSKAILTTEGVVPFFKQLVRWLGGERRSFRK